MTQSEDFESIVKETFNPMCNSWHWLYENCLEEAYSNISIALKFVFHTTIFKYYKQIILIYTWLDQLNIKENPELFTRANSLDVLPFWCFFCLFWAQNGSKSTGSDFYGIIGLNKVLLNDDFSEIWEPLFKNGKKGANSKFQERPKVFDSLQLSISKCQLFTKIP